MKVAGATGKIKESSTAVANHFERVMASSTSTALAVIEKSKRRRFYRGDVVEKVLSHYATSALEKCDCPVCHYDFRLLHSSKLPARYCPGCGTPVQNLINQLLNLLTP
jgi:rubrerythrin